MHQRVPNRRDLRDRVDAGGGGRTDGRHDRDWLERLGPILPDRLCQKVGAHAELSVGWNLPERRVAEADRDHRLVDRRVRLLRAVDAERRDLGPSGQPALPHAGDGGVLGTEERDTIVPALEALRAEGRLVDGPFPADTMFYKWETKGYDAFVALYHDQGMIPFKAGGFEEGVNMTIGLPVVRTSVCHGTAFDIAGKGTAETGSLASAFALAVECCLARRARQAAR